MMDLSMGKDVGVHVIVYEDPLLIALTISLGNIHDSMLFQ